MAEIEVSTGDCKFDKYDWIYFVAGGLAALVALYLIKNILEPQHHFHNYHHNYHQPRPIPISKEVEKVYKTSWDGKFYE